MDAILAAVTAKTKIVFLANPNNPTGTYLPFEEVRRLHAGLPKHVLLVLDAAYAEYVRRNDYEAGVELVAGAQNVVMTRTFSKMHGLAAPASAGCTRRRISSRRSTACAVRSTSMRLAIEAGIAAMRDRSHVERTVEHNGRWLRWLDGGAVPAWPAGHAERRQFRPHPLSGRREALGRGMRTIIFRRGAISCAASPGTVFPTRCA